MYTLCKLLYITVFALLSAVPPYLQIYYHDVLYFSSNQIGCVLAIAPFIQSLACPIWTYLVDKRPKLHGSIMAFTSLMGGLAILGIMILGHQQQQEDTTKDPSTPLFLSLILNNNNEQHSPPPPATQQTVILTSLCALMFAFFTLPNVSLVDSAVMKILGSNKILYGEQRLWGSVSAGFTILVVGELINLTNNLDAIFWVFGASTLAFIVISLSANNVISSSVYKDDDYKATECSKLLATNESRQQLNNEEDYEKEGSARGRYQSTMMHDERGLYRPTSCNSTVLSIAHDLREEADELLDTNVSPTTAPLQTAGLAISRVSSLEHSMLGGRELIDATSSASLSSTTAAATPMSSSNSHYQARFFTSPRVACFLITTLLFGVVLSMVVNFLFLFLSNDLHTPASWIGWTGPLQALTELLCFCFSKQMMEQFGTAWLIVFAHVCTSLRCLAYTLLPPDALSTNICVLLLQTLHGIGFGIFWGTAVSEMDAMFPANQRAVAQGVLGALHTGLGTGLGALIGGQLYDSFGAAGLFHSAAALSLISALIFCIGRRLDISS